MEKLINKTPTDLLKIIQYYKNGYEHQRNFKKCLTDIKNINYTIRYPIPCSRRIMNKTNRIYYWCFDNKELQIEKFTFPRTIFKSYVIQLARR